MSVRASTVNLLSGGAIDSDTGGEGRAGDVTLLAGKLTIDNGNSLQSAGIFTDSFPNYVNPEAGSIFVQAKDVSLSADAEIESDTLNDGSAGNVTVVAARLKMDGRGYTDTSIGSESLALHVAGSAGAVRIHAGSLSLFNGAEITTDTFSDGNAGNVSVIATQLLLQGSSQNEPATIASDALDGGTGAAGAVTVRSKSISVLGGGEISTSTSGTGPGGDVVVESDSLLLNASRTGRKPFTGIAALSDLHASGKAGRATVAVSGGLSIQGGAQITTTSRHAGGGNEMISAGRLDLVDGAITTSAADVGGKIAINAASLSLSPTGVISASSQGSAPGDNGGNISIGPTELAFFPAVLHGAISAKAIKGFGGNITVAPGGEVLASQGVNPSDEFTATGSTPGTIKVESPEVDLTGEVAPLVSPVVSNGLSLAPTCGMRAGPDQSSFTLEGGNGLPADPAETVPHGAEPTTLP